MGTRRLSSLTKKEIGKLVAFAAANHLNMQDKDLRPTAALWEKMLEDIPFAVAEKALVKVMATSKWFPTVAEIREAALEIAGIGIPDPATAWAEVMAEVRRIGTYGVPEFSCPEIKAAVSVIGWRDICLSENIGIERAHFMNAYKAYEEQAKERAQLPPSLRREIEQLTNEQRLAKITGGTGSGAH